MGPECTPNYCAPKGLALSCAHSHHSQGGVGEAGRNPHPMTLEAEIPLASRDTGFHLLFWVALCHRLAWELFQNNIQGSCHDPGDWNVSLGKPPWPCQAQSTAQPSLLRDGPATVSCLRGNVTAAPRGPATAIAVMPSVFAPLLSHLPPAENVLALGRDHCSCTGLGRQPRFMARAVRPMHCSAKGGGLLTPQTSHKSSPEGADSPSSTAPVALGSGSQHLSTLRAKSSLVLGCLRALTRPSSP